MIRLNIIVEGQTEEAFVNNVLRDHLASFQVFTSARRVETSRNGDVIFRGGMPAYPKVKKDIVNWLKEDKNSNARFTTMFDLYALSDDFPGFQRAENTSDSAKRVEALETSFQEDIADRRFLPYLQLHEYEALLLSDPSKFDGMFPDSEKGIENLKILTSNFASPEEIDDGPETAPSKRIIREIPEYKGMKPNAGPVVAMEIGLEKIRASCPHFNQWVEKLEKFAQEEQ